MKHVFLVGEDAPLRETRAAVLGRTGATVSACSPDELTATLDKARFDVLVLCHSLRGYKAKSCADRARRRWPHLPILQLVRYDFEKGLVSELKADAIAIGSEPQDVVRCAQQLLGDSADVRSAG